MKHRIGAIAAILALVGVTPVALAQSRATGAFARTPLAPAQPGAVPAGLSLLHLPEPLLDRLDLSPAQKAQLTALQSELQAEVRQLAFAPAAEGEKRGGLQHFREIAGAAEDRAGAILTPSQRTEFRSLQSFAQDLLGLGRLRVGVLAIQNLTVAQKNRLRQLALDTQQKRHEALQDTGLGPSQREAGLEKVRVVEHGLPEAITKILTDQQRKQYEAVQRGELPHPKGAASSLPAGS